MKKGILAVSFLLIFAKFAFGQNIHSTEVKDEKLKSILGAIDTVILKKNDNIFVTLFRVSNPSGSAHISESDEVTHRYLFLVSGYDEDPEQHLFNVGNFYNPKVVKIERASGDKYRVIIEHGFLKNRRKIFLNVTLNKVWITAK